MPDVKIHSRTSIHPSALFLESKLWFTVIQKHDTTANVKQLANCIWNWVYLEKRIKWLYFVAFCCGEVLVVIRQSQCAAAEVDLPFTICNKKHRWIWSSTRSTYAADEIIIIFLLLFLNIVHGFIGTYWS